MALTGTDLIRALMRSGCTRAAGVPCSYFGDFFAQAGRHPEFSYVPAANEGLATSLAAGWSLSGGLGVAVMQNSGLGNAVNPLTSLLEPYAIPALICVSGRGYGIDDEAQHRLMGARLDEWMSLSGVASTLCPETPEELSETIAVLVDAARTEGRPRGLIVPKGRFASWSSSVSDGEGPSRTEVVKTLLEGIGTRPLVATTGYLSRCAFEAGDRNRSFYMQGSMGHAAAIGLALSLDGHDPVVLDGDAALVMHLGVLATIGGAAPKKLTHIVVHNGACESTGGQDAGTGTVDFSAAALACGYRAARRTGADLAADLQWALATEGPVLLEIPSRLEGSQDLPRISPTLYHDSIARRLRDSLRGG